VVFDFDAFAGSQIQFLSVDFVYFGFGGIDACLHRSDCTAFGVGKLHRAIAPGGAERTLTYDTKGRLHTSQLRPSLGDAPLTFTYGYDEAQFGRLRTLQYPVPAGAAPYRVRYGYDAFGHLARVNDDISQAELWRKLAPATELADRQTRERFGNGVETTRTFEPTNGLLTQLRSVKPGIGGGPKDAH
jgi:hypothetical protein